MRRRNPYKRQSCDSISLFTNVTLLLRKPLFKATWFCLCFLLVLKLNTFLPFMSCVKLRKHSVAWHVFATFFLTYYPIRQMSNLHWHIPWRHRISIINSWLKSLHTLFCMGVVRWSRCAKGLREVLEGKMMSEKVKVQEVALFLVVVNGKHRCQELDVPWSDGQSSRPSKSPKPAVTNLSTELRNSYEQFLNGRLHRWLVSVGQDPNGEKGDSLGYAVAS